MTALKQLGALERQFELRRQCGEFGQLAHMLMASRGDNLSLKQLARESRNRVGKHEWQSGF